MIKTLVHLLSGPRGLGGIAVIEFPALPAIGHEIDVSTMQHYFDVGSRAEVIRVLWQYNEGDGIIPLLVLQDL